jgi:hypothetical protein
MQTNDRVSRLGKAVDDMYANIYLWHQLDRLKQDKLQELFKRMRNQLGVSGETERVVDFKKRSEDF